MVSCVRVVLPFRPSVAELFDVCGSCAGLRVSRTGFSGGDGVTLKMSKSFNFPLELLVLLCGERLLAEVLPRKSSRSLKSVLLGDSTGVGAGRFIGVLPFGLVLVPSRSKSSRGEELVVVVEIDCLEGVITGLLTPPNKSSNPPEDFTALAEIGTGAGDCLPPPPSKSKTSPSPK